MKLFQRNKKAKEENKPKSSNVVINSGNWKDTFVPIGYTRLTDNPDVRTCVDYIARTISCASIHLMQNTDGRDVRVNNALAKKINHKPNSYQTKQVWLENIVKNMMYNGNAVLNVRLKDSLIESIDPFDMNRIDIRRNETVFLPTNYEIHYKHMAYSNEDLLHFIYNVDIDNPYKGLGLTATAKGLVDAIADADRTKRKLLKTEGKPNLLIFLDALWSTFIPEDDEDKDADFKMKETIMREISNGIERGVTVLPTDEFLKVQELKPLSLKDLALSDNLILDKKAVAKLVGVPLYVLGLEKYDKDDHNDFLNTTIKQIVTAIEQELTDKTLLDPNLHWVIPIRSLTNFSVDDIISLSESLLPLGVLVGNEVRDMIGKEPKPELEKPMILENYIPVDKSGLQKKLKGDNKENEQN